MSTQSPVEEIAERVAEAAPGLAVATQMEAINAFRKANADYRRRVGNSHQWEAKALGVPDPGLPEEDPVGNLLVCGDVYGSDSAKIIAALQGQQTTPTATPTTPSAGMSTLAKAVTAAALLAGGGGAGVGIPWLMGMFSKSAAVAPVVPAATPATGFVIEKMTDPK